MLLLKRNDNYYQTADRKHYIKQTRSDNWVIGRRVLHIRIPLQKCRTLTQARYELERGLREC